MVQVQNHGPRIEKRQLLAEQFRIILKKTTSSKSYEVVTVTAESLDPVLAFDKCSAGKRNLGDGSSVKESSRALV